MIKKIAVVTGAGSGIGRDVTLRLTNDGYKVYMIGRRKELLNETAGLCVPGSTIEVSLDVTDYQGLKDLAATLDSVDVIVASAGVCIHSPLDGEDSDEIWKKVMSINVDGVWYLFRAFSEKLSDGGKAVVVSSGLGKLGRAGYGAYTASKHAVLGLVKCFAKELSERKITVNAVCPGWVDTKMARSDLQKTALENGTTPEKEYENAISSIPLKRFVQSDEVAALIQFLVSPVAAGITGQAYNISCGEFFA
ncbi:MAG: SDR family oxidoreductase [Deltaproteobacteria bacterium]|nr:SDR family oxidoreductase [Deltaproteobacteria bacterium]